MVKSPASYRPFTKLWLYEDARILSSVKTISKMFPRGDTSLDGEPTIIITSTNSRAVFGTLATVWLPDLCAPGTQGGLHIWKHSTR